MNPSNANAQSQPGGIAYIFSREVFRRNCVLAAIVGCLLTIANQLDVLLTQPFSIRLGSKINPLCGVFHKCSDQPQMRFQIQDKSVRELTKEF